MSTIFLHQLYQIFSVLLINKLFVLLVYNCWFQVMYIQNFMLNLAVNYFGNRETSKFHKISRPKLETACQWCLSTKHWFNYVYTLIQHESFKHYKSYILSDFLRFLAVAFTSIHQLMLFKYKSKTKQESKNEN